VIIRVDCFNFSSDTSSALFTCIKILSKISQSKKCNSQYYRTKPSCCEMLVSELMLVSIVAIPGETRLTVKVGLYSGLRQENIIYLQNTDICSNLSGCNYNNLHVIKRNAISLFCILPFICFQIVLIKNENVKFRKITLKRIAISCFVSIINSAQNSELEGTIGKTNYSTLPKTRGGILLAILQSLSCKSLLW
jgi:hypothetical protein